MAEVNVKNEICIIMHHELATELSDPSFLNYSSPLGIRMKSNLSYIKRTWMCSFCNKF